VDLLLHLIVSSKESMPSSWTDLLLDSFMSTYGGHTMEVSHLWGLLHIEDYSMELFEEETSTYGGFITLLFMHH
jgi:hypothetical protein